MNDVLQFIGKHWVDFGVAWLLIIKWLTVVQDAVDAQPKDLKPPFGKLLYYMSAISQSMLIGNRPQAITGGSNALSSSSSTANSTVVK
jgi:hypothetical protein